MENKFNLRRIFGNSMWQISEKILTMMLSVITTSVIARYLGTEEYGFVNYIISIVMLFTAFSTLGMEKITINDIVNEEYNRSTILGTSLIVRLLGGVVLMIISQITIFVLTDGDKISQIIGIIVSASMIFKAFEVIEYYLQAKMKLKVVSIIRFSVAILIAIIKILIVFLDFGVVGFSFTYFIDALIVAVLLYIYYKINNSDKLKFNKEYAKKLLKRCWYMAIAGLMTTIYMRIDQIMLGGMCIDKSENGIYSAAIRIAEMWYFVPLAIIASFQPIIIKDKKENHEENYKRNMQRLYDVVAIIGIICGIIITLFGDIAVHVLYGSEYGKASDVLCISVWAGLFATLGSARTVWLIAENKQKYTLVYTAVGCFTNIILNAVLIPSIGAFGAAIATLAAQCIANIFALIPFKDTSESSFMMLKAIFKNNTVKEILKKILIRNKLGQKNNVT